MLKAKTCSLLMCGMICIALYNIDSINHSSAGEKNNDNPTSEVKTEAKVDFNNPEYAAAYLKMEHEFLSTLKLKPNSLPSKSSKAKYLLTYQFPGTDQYQHSVILGIYKRTIMDILITKFNIKESIIRQQNNAVSWLMRLPIPNSAYNFPMNFVGIIDGDTIWGHVYRINSDKDGWHQTTFNIGVFKITPVTPENKSVDLEKKEENIQKPQTKNIIAISCRVRDEKNSKANIAFYINKIQTEYSYTDCLHATEKILQDNIKKENIIQVFVASKAEIKNQKTKILLKNFHEKIIMLGKKYSVRIEKYIPRNLDVYNPPFVLFDPAGSPTNNNKQ